MIISKNYYNLASELKKLEERISGILAAFLVKTYDRIKNPITAIGIKIEIKTTPAVISSQN